VRVAPCKRVEFSRLKWRSRQSLSQAAVYRVLPAILIFGFEVILLRCPSGQHGVIEGQGELLARSDEPCRSGRLGLRVSDGSQQGVPVREDDICRDGAQMLEEAVLGAAGGDGGAPGEDTEIGDGVKREGE
jgi:hypothetical protein